MSLLSSYRKILLVDQQIVMNMDGRSDQHLIFVIGWNCCLESLYVYWYELIWYRFWVGWAQVWQRSA